MQVALKPRTVGDLVGLSFRLIIQHLPALLVIGLLIQIPGFLIGLAMPAEPQSTDDVFAVLGGTLLSILISLVLPPLGAAVATLTVSQSFTGRSVTLGTALSIAIRRLWPLVLFSLAFGILASVGFLLLVVPGILIVVRYVVGAPTIVLEGVGAGDAFSRSAKLTEGRRGPIFGFLLLLYLIAMIPALVAGIVLAVIGAAQAEPGADPAAATEGPAFMVLMFAAGIFANLFYFVAPVAMYYDLRARKEALDADELARLVDELGEQA